MEISQQIAIFNVTSKPGPPALKASTLTEFCNRIYYLIPWPYSHILCTYDGFLSNVSLQCKIDGHCHRLILKFVIDRLIGN